MVNTKITLGIFVPIVVRFDVIKPAFADRIPFLAPGEEFVERVRAGRRIIRLEQEARIAIGDKLAVPADV